MKPRRRGWLARALTDDVGLKVLSIVASVSIFYLVRGAEDAQRSLFVDVVALLPDDREGRVLVSDVPDTIRLTLQGSRSVLNSVQREGLGPLQVDLRDGEGDYHFVDTSPLDLPLGVRVVQVAPSSIPLRWEPRRQKTLPVEARLDGEPRTGLEVEGKPTVSPRLLRVQGPASVLEPLEALHTEPVRLASLGFGMHTRRLGVEPPSPRVELPGDGTVEVSVRIAREVGRRALDPSPIAVLNAPARTRVRPRQARVTLVGPPAAVESVDVRQVIPFVELPEVAAGQRDAQATVLVRGLPEGVQAEVDPAEVLVTPPRPANPR